MEKENNIDLMVIKKYLATEKDEVKLKSFLRLYSNYSKLAKFDYNELEKFENEIYTIGREFGSLGKKVGEELAERLGIKIYNKELIKKEIMIIKTAIKKCDNKKIVDHVNSILNDIELIVNYDDSVFNGYIPFLKKCICELQSILKLDINFYNASCELFDNEYDSVKKFVLNTYKDNYKDNYNRR